MRRDGLTDWGGLPVCGDVRGDYEAARVATLVLRQAAVVLEETRALRQALGNAAQEQWTGRFGREFAARLEQVQRESSDLQARVLAAARMLDNAVEDAATDQRSRVARRELSTSGPSTIDNVSITP